ncbi:hypothetical protein CHCC20347_0464 [Bacillus paralicheniformis]|nr:hypothetical protein CHCC20347_0464 [Bacillus paralicheniformis]
MIGVKAIVIGSGLPVPAPHIKRSTKGVKARRGRSGSRLSVEAKTGVSLPDQ